MSRSGATPQVWGREYPFERNLLQRSITLAGLSAVLGVSLILLVAEDVFAVLGVALVYCGIVAGLAAVSRLRYVRESEAGFAILSTRDGRFVLWSAAASAAAGVVVTAVILR